MQDAFVSSVVACELRAKGKRATHEAVQLMKRIRSSQIPASRLHVRRVLDTLCLVISQVYSLAFFAQPKLAKSISASKGLRPDFLTSDKRLPSSVQCRARLAHVLGLVGVDGAICCSIVVKLETSCELDLFDCNEWAQRLCRDN